MSGKDCKEINYEINWDNNGESHESDHETNQRDQHEIVDYPEEQLEIVQPNSEELRHKEIEEIIPGLLNIDPDDIPPLPSITPKEYPN